MVDTHRVRDAWDVPNANEWAVSKTVTVLQYIRPHQNTRLEPQTFLIYHSVWKKKRLDLL